MCDAEDVDDEDERIFLEGQQRKPVARPKPAAAKRKQREPREPFVAEWVKLPRRWVKALRRTKSAATYQLAHAILFEAFKQDQFGRVGREVVLSSAVTKMPKETRRRATKELVKLGLIEVEQVGCEAPRVSKMCVE